MTKERTSISIDEVNKEYVDKTDINLSELVDKAINRRRLAATKSRPEQLREQINEKEEVLQEAEAKVRDIEAELEELREELELYESGKRDMVDDLLEVAELAIYITPDQRDINDLPMAKEAGVTPEQLADCLNYADVHAVNPVAFTSRKAMEEIQYYDNDERLVVPDELVRDDDDEANSDVPDHFVQLTDAQQEKVKEWAEREI